AQATEWIAAHTGDEASWAAGLRASGHIDYLRGRHEAALVRYREALELYERLGREGDAGRTMSGALHALAYLGKYAEASASGERVRAMFSRHGARAPLAIVENNMANVFYRLDRFQEALQLYRRAQQEFDAIGDAANAAIALKNIATCQISLNEFRP